MVDTRISRVISANEDRCSYGCRIGLLPTLVMLPRSLPSPTQCDKGVYELLDLSGNLQILNPA